MVCGGPENINREKGFMFASLIRSLDTDWQTYVRQKPNIETCTMEEIFEVIEKQMMITKLMSVRRSEFVRIKQHDGENASSFLRRVMAKARSSDIRSMTQEEHILLMFWNEPLKK